MYMGLLKGKVHTPQKMLVQGRTTTHALSRFVCSVYSLSGPFSLLREP
jgi:hypothetical protein